MKPSDRSIYYTCPFVPPEWIAAHGMSPHRVFPPGSPPGAPIGNLTGLCPFARAFGNYAAALEDAAAVIVTTACDQMRRTADLIAASTDTPLFVMDVPHTWQESAAVKLYVSELRRLGRFLVSLGGTAPSEDASISPAKCPIPKALPTNRLDRLSHWWEALCSETALKCST